MTKHEAEIAVSQILKQLEIDTGELIDRVEIVDADVTTINSTRQELLAWVCIALKPVPGRRWA